MGFAAETENVIAHAIEKLHRKKMDMIVANDVSNDQVMGRDFNSVTIIDKNENKTDILNADKKVIAMQLLEIIANKT